MPEVPDYFNRVNPDLLALIPPDAKTVLEIGCGAGALCEAYRRVNPDVEWIGCDANAEALEIAQNRGVTTMHKDLDASLPAMGWDHDVVIFGDVLEHVHDPWNVMKWAVAHTEPGAQILASIPNVQHWTVIRDLLNGKWTYTDEGLLDRTHLRFFTLDSIREMFEQAGLQIFEIRGRDICNEGFDEWTNSMPADFPFRKEMRAYQYIVRAIKPGEPDIVIRNGYTFCIDQPIQKLHIHAVTAEECCARPRILEPFKMLETVPGVTCTSSEHGFRGNPEIVIYQRPHELSVNVWRAISAQMHIVVVELDDEPEAIGVPIEALKTCHAVQVSTEPLAEIVRQWNPNVMVFPNQIAELPPWEEKPKREQIRIFYGAQNRKNDWKPIMPALNKLINEYPTILEFAVIHDKEFYYDLNTCRRTFQPFCGYTEYRSILRSCDIALLPLEPSRFNECKSDLKFLECAAEGVTVIAGPVTFDFLCNIEQVTCAPKDDKLKNGIYVLGYNNAASFEQSLRGAIKYAGHRHEVAETAYYYVSRYRLLSQHFRKRLAWYQELLATKPSLDRQLWERVPELAPRDLVGSSA